MLGLNSCQADASVYDIDTRERTNDEIKLAHVTSSIRYFLCIALVVVAASRISRICLRCSVISDFSAWTNQPTSSRDFLKVGNVCERQSCSHFDLYFSAVFRSREYRGTLQLKPTHGMSWNFRGVPMLLFMQLCPRNCHLPMRRSLCLTHHFRESFIFVTLAERSTHRRTSSSHPHLQQLWRPFRH